MSGDGMGYRFLIYLFPGNRITGFPRVLRTRWRNAFAEKPADSHRLNKTLDLCVGCGDYIPRMNLLKVPSVFVRIVRTPARSATVRLHSTPTAPHSDTLTGLLAIDQ